jgi:hypothetical protein
VFHNVDQSRQIALCAEGIASIMERVSPIFDVMRAAASAEPGVSNLLSRLLRERLVGMRLAVEAVARNVRCEPGSQ